MAQDTNYTPIKPFRSNTATNAPTTSNLLEGEIAVNVADKKIFIRDDSNNIITLSDGDAIAQNTADITQLQSDVSTNTTNISSIDSRVTVNEGDISTISGSVSTNSTNISTIQTSISNITNSSGPSGSGNRIAWRYYRMVNMSTTATNVNIKEIRFGVISEVDGTLGWTAPTSITSSSSPDDGFITTLIDGETLTGSGVVWTAAAAAALTLTFDFTTPQPIVAIRQFLDNGSDPYGVGYLDNFQVEASNDGVSWDKIYYTPVLDPETTGDQFTQWYWLLDDQEGIGEAPDDGQQYARKSEAWAVVSSGGGDSPSANSYTVKSSGGDFADLDEALAYLNSKPVPRTDGYNVVTLLLDPGTDYDVSEVVVNTAYRIRFERASAGTSPRIVNSSNYLYFQGIGSGATILEFNNVDIGSGAEDLDFYYITLDLSGDSDIFGGTSYDVYSEDMRLFVKGTQGVSFGPGSHYNSYVSISSAVNFNITGGTSSWVNSNIRVAATLQVDSGAQMYVEGCDIKVDTLQASNPSGGYFFSTSSSHSTIHATDLNSSGSTGLTGWHNGTTINTLGQTTGMLIHGG